WSLRYGHSAIHVLGVMAAFAAYHCAPAFWGGHPRFTTWNDLGFLALLAGLGFLLARRQAAEDLRATHGALTALVILRTTAPPPPPRPRGRRAPARVSPPRRPPPPPLQAG